MGMLANMSQAEQEFQDKIQKNEETLRDEILAMKQMLNQMGTGDTGSGNGGKGVGADGNEGMVLLNRKDFALVDKFDGNQSKFKSWLFDLLTAMGSIDSVLAKETKQLLKARPKIVMDEGALEIPNDLSLDLPSGAGPTNHATYEGELYALIVSLTTGDANCVVRCISEKGWEADGFLALTMLQARYDANTAASLLQCVMEVVNPPALKNHQGILKGIAEWEVRVDSLKMKHDESISASIKIVVFVGMLPKEYQDLCFRQALCVKMREELQYIEMRDKIMNLASQRISMVTPSPMDIYAVNQNM